MYNNYFSNFQPTNMRYPYAGYFYRRKRGNIWLKNLAMIGGVTIMGGLFLRLRAMEPLREVIGRAMGQGYRIGKRLGGKLGGRLFKHVSKYTATGYIPSGLRNTFTLF